MYYNVVGCHLQCWYCYWMLVQILATLLLRQLSYNGLGNSAVHNPGTWDVTTRLGNQEEAPTPGFDLDQTSHCGHLEKELADGSSFSLFSASLPFSLQLFQTNKSLKNYLRKWNSETLQKVRNSVSEFSGLKTGQTEGYVGKRWAGNGERDLRERWEREADFKEFGNNIAWENKSNICGRPGSSKLRGRSWCYTLFKILFITVP